MLANYQCGQNEVISVPSGDIIQVKAGDEIAINSIAFEVVELDGSGNGSGIVKVPMFQNAKFGVEFKGIKVAKGGCVVAGQAELSNVDVALLNEEQRKKLAETYEAFNKVLDVVDANAEGVAETFNSVWALMDGIKDRAAKLAAKLSGGQNPTAKEIKDLAKLTENSAAMLQKSLNDIKKQAQANADAGKVDEMQKIIDQQKASAKALLASAKDIKMGKDKLPTPQDPMEKANTQKQVDALAMTNGADVKKKLDGLKGISNLMIEYNKIPYANGKTITISNKEAVSGFTLKNVIEGEDLAWVVKDGDKVLNNFTANPVGLMWPDGKTKLTLEATQGSRKMSLTLQRKTFALDHLYAIDKDNTSRKAKEDEILYLVGQSSNGVGMVTSETFFNRKVKYEFSTTPKADRAELLSFKPKWNFITMSSNGVVKSDVKEENIPSNTIDRTYSNYSDGGYFSTDVRFFGSNKEVKIMAIKPYYGKVSYLEKFVPLFKLIDDIGYVSSTLDKFGFPCKISLLSMNDIKDRPNDIDLSVAGYNGEDTKTRHIFDIKEVVLKLSGRKLFEFKCVKTLGWGGLSLGDLYGSLSCTPEFAVSAMYKTNYETKDSKWGGKGNIAIPVKAEFGLEKKVSGFLSYNISVPIVFGGKGEYPYKGDFRTAATWWYLDRTNVNFTANVSVGILGEKNIKVTYLLFDTKWESEKSEWHLDQISK